MLVCVWCFLVFSCFATFVSWYNFLQIIFCAVLTWSSEEAMGSCCSCPDKDTVPDNHRNKFKVSKASKTMLFFFCLLGCTWKLIHLAVFLFITQNPLFPHLSHSLPFLIWVNGTFLLTIWIIGPFPITVTNASGSILTKERGVSSL